MAKMFSMFDPAREGKGVKKPTGEKKRFFLFFELVGRKFGKLCLLNVIYVLCCIPVVTIGPATAAMMLVLRNMAQEKPVFVATDFFDAFKKNFKRSFVTGLLVLIIGAVIIFAFDFYYQLINALETGEITSFMGMEAGAGEFFCSVAAIATFVIGFFMMFMSYYVYLLIVTVDLPLKKIYKNSALLALAGFKTNIITTVWVAAIVALSVLGLQLIPINLVVMVLYVLFFFAFIHFIIAFNSYQYIKKYVTDPFYAAKGERAPDDPVEGENIFED